MGRSEASSPVFAVSWARSPDYKRLIWETFEMSQKGEVDPELVPYLWHWLMYPLTDLLGPELVYSVGIEALGYPPTWVDTVEEVRIVDAALVKHLNGE